MDVSDLIPSVAIASEWRLYFYANSKFTSLELTHREDPLIQPKAA